MLIRRVQRFGTKTQIREGVQREGKFKEVQIGSDSAECSDNFPLVFPILGSKRSKKSINTKKLVKNTPEDFCD